MSQNTQDDVCSVLINIEYGSLTQYIDWCNKNCTGEWSFVDTSIDCDTRDYWLFVFHSEQDFLMFNLRWK